VQANSHDSAMTGENLTRQNFGKTEGQPITGVCCQWRGSASYDSDVHFETFVLRRKFSGEIATRHRTATANR